MTGGSQNPSGKNRKYGRNATWCQIYRQTGQREKNKKKKLMRIYRRLKRKLRKRLGYVPDKELIKSLERMGVNVSSL